MINFGWENQTERLKRHMSIAPKKKLELLYELNRFTRKYAIKKARSHYRKTISQVKKSPAQ